MKNLPTSWILMYTNCAILSHWHFLGVEKSGPTLKIHLSNWWYFHLKQQQPQKCCILFLFFLFNIKIRNNSPSWIGIGPRTEKTRLVLPFVFSILDSFFLLKQRNNNSYLMFWETNWTSPAIKCLNETEIALLLEMIT